MIPNDLLAQPGDKILGKFKKLVAYIDAQKALSTDERVQINETPNGTQIMLLPKGGNLSFEHPFKIKLEGRNAFRVSEGYVNNKLPLIRTRGINGKILHNILSETDGVGIIPSNLERPDTQWIFVCTILVTSGNEELVAYIECINSELAEKQQILMEEMVLGKSHLPRNVDFFVGQREFYVPMAFMRTDRVIHNFTWHNIYYRTYKIGATNRVIFWPG
jgi:hypothetical protein